MTTATTSPTDAALPGTGRATRSAVQASQAAFKALLLRDVTVLRKNLKEFIPRTVLQPFLLVFVFTFVFPKIGQGIGASHGGPGAASFATLLVAGVVGITILFQGIQSVALPMVQEFGYTKEIEDRVLAPLPISLVAIGKITAGMLNGLFAALLVFPIAAFVPATPVHLHVNWLVLLTLTPLALLTAAALGLSFGTRFEPRQVPILFGIIVLPLTFLGAVYYSWSTLGPVKVLGFSWLKYLVLLNPLVYISEGFRAALTRGPHMSLWGVYGALLLFAALLTWQGLEGFRARVVS